MANVTKSTRLEESLRFCSWLKAELDVQGFERERERLRQRHVNGERARRALRLQRDRELGVVAIEAEVIANSK